jgi:hypothetical protein
MVFVFTAVHAFYFILFWNAAKLNRMAEQKAQ